MKTRSTRGLLNFFLFSTHQTSGLAPHVEEQRYWCTENVNVKASGRIGMYFGGGGKKDMLNRSAVTVPIPRVC